MSNQNEKCEKWYKKVWIWILAIGAGIVAFIRLKRTGVSGQPRTGIERVGEDIERVGDNVTRTSEIVTELAGTVSDIDDTAQRITDTSERLSSTSERVTELNNEATSSVARIRDLIRAERQRLKDLENNK